MLKRLMILLLISLIGISGCAKKSCDNVAVLVKADENKAIIIYSDSEYDVLYKNSISYPDDVFFTNEATYYCTDSKEGKYESVLFNSNKKGNDLEKVSGELLYANQTGCYFSALADKIYFYDGITKIEYEIDFVSSIINNDKIYIYGADSFMYILSCETGELVNKYEVLLNDESEVNMTTMDDMVYMFGKNGLTELSDEGYAMTYVYPVEFEEVYGGRDNTISGVENGEFVTYEMKIENHRLVFTFISDSSYYEDYEFEKYFADFYRQGYEILYFYEY